MPVRGGMGCGWGQGRGIFLPSSPLSWIRGTNGCKCNYFYRLFTFFTVRNFDCTRCNFLCTRRNFRTNFCGSHTRRENQVIRCDLSRTKFFGQIMAINSDNRSCPISIKEYGNEWNYDSTVDASRITMAIMYNYFFCCALAWDHFSLNVTIEYSNINVENSNNYIKQKTIF